MPACSVICQLLDANCVKSLVNEVKNGLEAIGSTDIKNQLFTKSLLKFDVLVLRSGPN
jgi:hypothetical protein